MLEVHAYRVIENVEFGLRLLLLLLFLILLSVLESVHVGGVDDVDLETAQAVHDGIHLIRVVDAIRESFVEVVKGEVALLLCEFDEILDLLLKLRLVEVGGGALLAFRRAWRCGGLLGLWLDGLGLGLRFDRGLGLGC